MTITQMIQTSPLKANELFGKLADTSEGAVKTREKLFAELKEELELHTRLEEQHLFPVLRRHKETKDLVTDAVNDDKQTRALLAELERLPKDGDDFPRKLTELRKVFQSHVRDEKKDLLPVVRKALSDEEAQAIAETIEADRAKAEEAKREEARAAERRTRQTAAAALRAGTGVAEESTRRAADMVSQTVRTTAQPALERLEAFGALPAIATRAAGEAGEVWMEWAIRTTRASVGTMQELATCASPLHLALVRMRLASEAMQAWLDLGTRLAQISFRASEEMLHPRK